MTQQFLGIHTGDGSFSPRVCQFGALRKSGLGFTGGLARMTCVGSKIPLARKSAGGSMPNMARMCIVDYNVFMARMPRMDFMPPVARMCVLGFTLCVAVVL